MEVKPAFFRLSRERRRTLLDTAMDIYLEYPYEEVSARLLCGRMGLNPATFYRYFGTKDDLLLYLFSQINRRIGENVDESTLLTTFETEPLPYLSEKENAFSALWYQFPDKVVHDLYFETMASAYDLYRKVLSSEIARGNIRPDTNVELVAYLYATVGYNLYRYWRSTASGRDYLAQCKRYLYLSFFTGIMTPQGQSRIASADQPSVRKL